MPPPRRILVHLDAPETAACRLTAALGLSRPLDADVLACYCAPPGALRHALQVGLAVRGVEQYEREDRSRCDATYAVFCQTCGGEPDAKWLECAGEPELLFARQALYADYLVLQHAGEADLQAGVSTAFVDRVLVQAGKPAVVLPRDGAVRPLPRTIAVAWSETREAAHALSSAMPLLRAAANIHVIGAGEGADASVAALASRLDEQGLDPALHCLDEGGADFGLPLLDYASELGADLLVMGCYGHGPARERLLGGVTRTVLDSARLPVLMAH